MRSDFSLKYCNTEVGHTRRHQSVLCVSKSFSSSNGLRKPLKKQTRKTATRVVILCPVRSSCCLLSNWYQLYCFQCITADVFFLFRHQLYCFRYVARLCVCVCCCCCCCCLHIKSRSGLYSVLSNIRTGPTDADAFRGHRLTTQKGYTYQKEIKGPRKVNTHAII